MPQLLHEEQRQWCFLYLPHRLFRAPQKNMASRWVVKAGLLCPSEWFQTEAHQQEGEMMVLQVAPAGALGLKSLPTLEQVSAWRPSGPFVGISLQKHPKARHSFPLVNSGNALRQPHSTLLSRAGLCGEALCVQTVSRQGSGAAATWRGPEAGPSSQCPQPSAFVYVLALATNRVLSEASWESCIPFISAERDPRWQILPSFNYRNSQQTHGKRLKGAEKRARLHHIPPPPTPALLLARVSHLGFSNESCSWSYFPPENCHHSPGKLNSEAPNQGKNELHLGKNSSVAWNLIKIPKLGGVFTFFIWAYICKEKWDTKAIIWINQSQRNTYPHKTNRLLHHFPELLERRAELCGCEEPSKSFVHHCIQRWGRQTPRRNDALVLTVIETGLMKPISPCSLKWPHSGLSLMLKWFAFP